MKVQIRPRGPSSTKIRFAPGVTVSPESAFVAASDTQETRALRDWLKGLGRDVTPPVGGFFIDDQPETKIWRFRDRAFFGAAAQYTGRRTAPLGGSWLTTYGANYFEKNSQFIFLSDQQRYCALFGGYTPAGATTGNNGALFAVSINRGTGTYGRAIYAEAMHQGNAYATGAAEFQVGNYTNVDPVAPTPYGLGPGASGLSINAESGYGYTLGDTNTPLTPPLYAASNALNIGGGSVAASYQRFKVGLLFTVNSLYRGTDGLTGTASAIRLAQGHQIEFWSATSIMNAKIRSDGVASAGTDTALIFNNNKVSITAGATEVPMISFLRDTVGAGAVNWLTVKNARTNNGPIIGVDGTDTNIPLTFQSLGTGIIRFLSGGGANEQVRIASVASAVNALSLAGSVAGAGVTLGALGADSDIDVRVVPKGANGRLRYGSRIATGDVAVNGYVEIKDISGNIIKLATVA